MKKLSLRQKIQLGYIFTFILNLYLIYGCIENEYSIPKYIIIITIITGILTLGKLSYRKVGNKKC